MSEPEKIQFNFKNIPIPPARYEILLDESVNKRNLRIPLLFEYKYFSGEVECAVQSIDGNNIEDLQISCERITFGLDENTEYLIPDVDLCVKFVGKGKFEEKTVTAVTLKIGDTIVKAPVSIKIYDRKEYGVYNNLDTFTTADTNIGLINIADSLYTDRRTITANKSVTIKEIKYIGDWSIRYFRLSILDNDTREPILITTNNIDINVDITSGEVIEAVWKLPDIPDNTSYFGVENIVKYTYNNQTYIDTWIVNACYLEIIESIIDAL